MTKIGTGKRLKGFMVRDENGVPVFGDFVISAGGCLMQYHDRLGHYVPVLQEGKLTVQYGEGEIETW